MLELKGMLFTLMLTCISVYDAQTHTIPNIFLVPVMAIGLIDFESSIAVPGFFIVSTVLYVTSKLTQDGIGGGDIKFIAAAGFVLGYKAILFAAISGCILFLFASLVFQGKKEYYAMAPWLSLGCYFAYIMFN